MKTINMQIEIKEYFDPELNKRTYVYHMYDGPDGIDDFHGEYDSLGETFENIIKNRTLNLLHYK